MAEHSAERVKAMVRQISEIQPVKQAEKKRGRPQQLLMEHLSLSILWCFLHGWHAQLELWRFLRTQTIGRFAPIEVCDQAVYKRLA